MKMKTERRVVMESKLEIYKNKFKSKIWIKYAYN